MMFAALATNSNRRLSAACVVSNISSLLIFVGLGSFLLVEVFNNYGTAYYRSVDDFLQSQMRISVASYVILKRNITCHCNYYC